MTFRKQPRQFRISHLVSVSVLALTLGGAAFWSDSDYASTAPALSYAQEDLNARADLRQREGVLSGVTPSLSLLDAPAAAREEATASSEELTVEDNVIHEGSPRHLVAEYISRTFRVSMRDARQITGLVEHLEQVGVHLLHARTAPALAAEFDRGEVAQGKNSHKKLLIFGQEHTISRG